MIEGKREREREGEVAWEGDIEGLISNVRGIADWMWNLAK